MSHAVFGSLTLKRSFPASEIEAGVRCFACGHRGAARPLLGLSWQLVSQVPGSLRSQMPIQLGWVLTGAQGLSWEAREQG